VIVSNFGHSSMNIKDLGVYLSSGDFRAAKHAQSSSLKMSLLLSVPLSTVGILYVIQKELPPIYLLLFMASPGMAALTLLATTFRANTDSTIAPFFELGFISLVTSLILCANYYLGIDTSFTALGIVIFVVIHVFLALGFFALSIRIPELRGKSEQSSWRLFDQFERSKNFFVIEFAQYFSQWGLVLVIGLFLSAEHVGAFFVILKLSLIINFILGVTSNAISAHIAGLYAAQDLNRMKKVRGQARFMMLAISSPLAALMIVLNTQLLDYFQVVHEAAACILIGLVIVQVLNVVTGISPVVLKMTGYDAVLRNIVLFSLILQVVLAFLLSPVYGIFGAAIAYSVGPITKNFLALRHERQHLVNRKRAWS